MGNTMSIKKILNAKAKELMSKVPQDIKGQTDSFIKEVAKAVDSEIREANKRADKAEKSVAGMVQGGESGGEAHLLKEKRCTTGTYLTLFRASAPDTALLCIYPKSTGDGQHPYCCSACAGFRVNPGGAVTICTGVTLDIIKE